MPWWALLCVLALPLLAVAAKEPLHLLLAKRHGHGGARGTLGETVIVSAVEAFETVLGFLANTMSFVRLAAFAIAHAAVLHGVVRHCRATPQGPGAGGRVLGMLVIILGKLVAIGLEGLVAFVQALRLEYYEFFGKFFSGAGRPFKPFRLQGKENGQPS